MGRKRTAPSRPRAEPLSTNLERMMEEHDPPLNPRALALKAGINEWGVRDILNGKSRHPQHSTIEKIAQAGGRSVEWLTGELSDFHAELRAETDDLTPGETAEALRYIRFLKSSRGSSAA